MINVNPHSRDSAIAQLTRLPKVGESALSKETVNFFQSVAGDRTVSVIGQEKANDAPSGINIEERLYEAVAVAKIATSHVAMYLDPEWRKRLFRQLDSLHDVAEWEPGTSPVTRSSFVGFLRAMFYVKPLRKPGLGLSVYGELLAAWTIGKDELTLRFMDENHARISVRREVGDKQEVGVYESAIDRLPDLLTAFNAKHWLESEPSA